MEGYWFDPKHGGCLRLVSEDGKGAYVIHGAYGDDEPPANAEAYWYALARSDSRARGALIVDFVGKPHKVRTRYRAVLDGRNLHWDDGNVWRKAYTTPRLLLAARTPTVDLVLLVSGLSLLLLSLRGAPAISTPWPRAWLAGTGVVMVASELARCTYRRG